MASLPALEIDMTIAEEFNEWFEEQRADGLIDFKFDIRSCPPCTTKEDVMSEILFCERQIASGNVEEIKKSVPVVK